MRKITENSQEADEQKANGRNNSHHCWPPALLATMLRVRVVYSLRTADAFPVVGPLPPKNSYFSEARKQRPEMRLLFAGYVV